MVPEKKRTIFRAFAAIYLTAFGILAWLVFFNAGLDIVEGTGNQSNAVFIKNVSGRTITDITVMAVSGQESTVVQFIPSLAQQEMKKVETEKIPQAQSVLLTASAPFYQKAEKTFFPTSALGNLDLRIEAPTIVFLGSSAKFIINACNKNPLQQDVTITAEFEEAFFEKSSEEKMLSLSQGECIVHEFENTPLKTGTTTMYFNIEANDYSEKIEKTVKVE